MIPLPVGTRVNVMVCAEYTFDGTVAYDDRGIQCLENATQWIGGEARPIGTIYVNNWLVVALASEK